MRPIPQLKEAILTEDNVIDLNSKRNKPALITGGPVGPENWLKDQPKGAIILARQKSSNDLILNKYLVCEHLTQSTNLLWAIPDGKQMDIWVPTLEFSRKFALHEVAGRIGLPEDQQEEEQVNHEQVQSVVSGIQGSSAAGTPEDAGSGG